MSKKIKVLRIINRFNLGGPTYNVAYLSKYLGDEFETLLVGGEKDDSEDSSTFISDGMGLDPIIIDEMKREINPSMDYKAYKKLTNIIKEYKPDIVHTHASKAGALGRLAAYNCGVKYIYHTFHGHVFHSYFSKPKTMFYKAVERYLAKKSTSLVAISNIQKKELTEDHKISTKEKFKVVSLGFDLKRFTENIPHNRTDFRKQYKLEEDEIAIGIVGRLVPIKNHKFFLDAVKAMQKQTKVKLRYFIIGGGELEEELKEYCKTLNLDYTEGNDRKALVCFASWIRKVDWAYAGLDIVVLTSLNEGTPVSLIEAQASGKPIVSSRVGGIGDILIENETGYLYHSNDLNGYIDKLKNLIENENIRNQMGKKGPENVLQKFSFNRLVSDMKDLYFTDMNTKNV